METRAHKNVNFQHHSETKMSQIIVFWSNCEIKLLRNALNCEIKMPRKSKIVQKTAKLKYRENFIPRKFLVLK